MLRPLLLALLGANLLFFAWSQGWLGGRATGEPQRLASQVRPEWVRVLPPASPASAKVSAQSPASAASDAAQAGEAGSGAASAGSALAGDVTPATGTPALGSRPARQPADDR
jgi:hypothetical protein